MTKEDEMEDEQEEEHHSVVNKGKINAMLCKP